MLEAVRPRPLPGPARLRRSFSVLPAAACRRKKPARLCFPPPWKAGPVPLRFHFPSGLLARKGRRLLEARHKGRAGSRSARGAPAQGGERAPSRLLLAVRVFPVSIGAKFVPYGLPPRSSTRQGNPVRAALLASGILKDRDMIRSAFAIAVFMAALEKKGCFWQLRVQVLEC